MKTNVEPFTQSSRGERANLFVPLFSFSRFLDLTPFNRGNPLISRLCTTFHVNQIFFHPAHHSPFSPFNLEPLLRVPPSLRRHVAMSPRRFLRTPYCTAVFCTVPPNERFLSRPFTISNSCSLVSIRGSFLPQTPCRPVNFTHGHITDSSGHITQTPNSTLKPPARELRSKTYKLSKLETRNPKLETASYASHRNVDFPVASACNNSF